MKKKIILLLVIMSLCICILGEGADAKEKQLKSQDTEYEYKDRMFGISPMYVTNDGKIHYLWYGYKSGKEYAEVHRDSIENKKIENTVLFKDSSIDYAGVFSDIRIIDDKYLTIRMNYNKKGQTAVIKEYNKKRKKIFSYKDDIDDKNNTNTFGFKGWDDGRNIYYTYVEYTYGENSYKFNTRCINKKSKKAKNMRSFKLDVSEIDQPTMRIKIEKQKIYVLCKEKIYVYSLNGKLLKTCNLPDGERTIRLGNGSENTNYLTFNHFSVSENYIFYCNRNGIYRWNMKGKGGFKLYYNAQNDKYFGQEYGVKDICVKDKDTIYIMLESMKDYELVSPSKIVRYSR